MTSTHFSLLTAYSTHYSLATRRGFSSIEYAVLIAIVVAGVVGMSVYLARSLAGRWREAADVFGHGRQYEPGVTVETNTLKVIRR